MIIASSPLRVSLFGGGTDLPEFYENNRCHVLGFSSNYKCYVNLNISPLFVRKKPIRLIYSKTEEVDSTTDINHPLIKCYFEKYNINAAELHFSCDLPAVSGLGSSSAFACALGASLRQNANITLNSEELYQESIYMERVKLAEAGGIQDQIITSTGGICEITTTDSNINVNKLKIDKRFIKEFEKHLILIKVGWGSNSNRVSYELEKNKTKTNDNISILKDILSHSDTGIETFKNQNISDCGEIIKNIWNLKKLYDGVSNQEIDACAEYLSSKGAFGWRLLGAGGRGFMLGLANPNVVKDIMLELGLNVALPLYISDDGTKILE